MDCMNNVNYICRWRVRDRVPPPDGWTGLGVTDLDGDECHSYVDDLRHYRDILVQWLDVTAIPAVPRADVQAAVDEMRVERDNVKGVQSRGFDVLIAAMAVKTYDDSIDRIANHTGVVPSEVTP